MTFIILHLKLTTFHDKCTYTVNTKYSEIVMHSTYLRSCGGSLITLCTFWDSSLSYMYKIIGQYHT